MYKINGLSKKDIMFKLKIKAEVIYKDKEDIKKFLHGAESLYDIINGSDTYESNAKKIKAYREALGISKREMSKLIDIPDHKYYRIEYGIQSDNEVTKYIEDQFFIHAKHKNGFNSLNVAKAISAFFDTTIELVSTRRFPQEALTAKVIAYILRDVIGVNDHIIAYTLNRKKTSLYDMIFECKKKMDNDDKFMKQVTTLKEIFDE